MFELRAKKVEATDRLQKTFKYSIAVPPGDVIYSDLKITDHGIEANNSKLDLLTVKR